MTVPALAKLGRRRRRVVVIIAELLVVALAAATYVLLTRNAQPRPVRVVAVGDMVCDPQDPVFAIQPNRDDRCRHRDVARLAVDLKPDLLLGLGDYQYETPTAEAYQTGYAPTWGRLRSKTIPAVGNQEYTVKDARPFVDYFGGQVRDPRGYWSQDAGGWHLVVLNSNCSAIPGGCGDGSQQQQWLEADLAAADGCVLAVWHHPRWSSGIAGSDERTKSLYRTLFKHHVALLLSGHDADYERFGPLDPTGRADPHGVRQFVVGTGGEAHYRPRLGDAPWRSTTTAPASEYVDYDHHGVLELQLRPGGWRWAWHPLGAVVADRGAGTCER